jgi:hypothetical protein
MPSAEITLNQTSSADRTECKLLDFAED